MKSVNLKSASVARSRGSSVKVIWYVLVTKKWFWFYYWMSATSAFTSQEESLMSSNGHGFCNNETSKTKYRVLRIRKNIHTTHDLWKWSRCFIVHAKAYMMLLKEHYLFIWKSYLFNINRTKNYLIWNSVPISLEKFIKTNNNIMGIVNI